MPVFLFEAPVPTKEEPDAVYCFGVIAQTPGEAQRIVKLLADAEYLGEQWEPEATALEVYKKHLN